MIYHKTSHTHTHTHTHTNYMDAVRHMMININKAYHIPDPQDDGACADMAAQAAGA